MKFHYLARGLCISREHVLLARQLGAKNTFLPGGHIENGERAVDALIREIREELGVEAEVKEYLGAIEHTYPENSHDNYEINLIFKFEAPSLIPPNKPNSNEPHLEFLCPQFPVAHSHDAQPPLDAQEIPELSHSRGSQGSRLRLLPFHLF